MAGRNFAPFPILKTDRLTLKQLASCDDNEIFASRYDEAVNKFLDRTAFDFSNDNLKAEIGYELLPSFLVL